MSTEERGPGHHPYTPCPNSQRLCAYIETVHAMFDYVITLFLSQLIECVLKQGLGTLYLNMSTRLFSLN